MLNRQQVILVQIAVRQAGLRTAANSGRYRLLLTQYRQPDGSTVTSSKQLNNWQLEDLLAICEAHGFRQPGKPENYFRKKIANSRIVGDVASFAQQSAIRNLAGDLGWTTFQLQGMIKRISSERIGNIASLTPKEAYNLIEALKAILSRQMNKNYSNLNQITEDFGEARDGKKQAVKVS